MPKSKVLIIQEYFPHYRQRFFELLHQKLAARDIELQLVYSPNIASNLLVGDLSWATQIPVRHWGPFAWQNVCAEAADADLVIVQQESKYIVNYLLSFNRLFSNRKLAYWGHGRNFQSERASIVGERLKRFFSKFCDWWFAYNDLSASIVESLGFPRERITSVQNSIDTHAIAEAGHAVTSETLESLRKSLGIHSKNVGIFTGGLYAEKRLNFLFESCALIRQRVPDFEIIVIGKGPDADLVQKQAKRHSWIHYVGAKDDAEKVPYWKLSKLLLMPGLVGLVVLDSFALGVPMVTTDYPNHSPEFSYLKNGMNGIIVSPWSDPVSYATRVADLLLNSLEISRLRNNALEASKCYSAENMAENFALGIEAALNAPALSRWRTRRKR